MKTLYKALSWIVALLLPVVIVLAVVRLLINPWFLEFEYRTPGFPSDEYGFTRQERLKYGKIAVEYLVNDSDISFLGDLQFHPGQQVPDPSCQYMTDCSRLYNGRELQHMVDVKKVVQASLVVLQVGLVIILALGVWAFWGGWGGHYLLGLQRGGILVLALLGLVILFVIVAFNYIFVLFHEIFFQSGTWTFLYSDTLIRLFPERFWMIAFLMVGALSIVIGLLFYFFSKRALRRSARLTEEKKSTGT